MHRLFFALRPDPATRHRLADLARQLSGRYPARWVAPARYHLTLAFMGRYTEYPARDIERLMRAADSVCAAPFTWRPDRVSGFPARHPPCVLRGHDSCAGLSVLRESLVQASVAAGLTLPSEHRYVAHVTLGYGREHVIDEASVAPMTWRAEGFALLHSGDAAPGNHEVSGHWPLDGA